MEDMEALAGALLHEHPYTPEDIQSRVSVSQLTDLFEGDDSSSAGAVSIQDVLGHANDYRLNQRARHVYSEAARVLAFSAVCDRVADAQRRIATEDELRALGRLANESQASCRDLYGCSSAELDSLTAHALDAGAYGSRLTGAGWGGSTVSFLREGTEDKFLRTLEEKFYQRRTTTSTDRGGGEECAPAVAAFACKPVCGASVYRPSETTNNNRTTTE